MPFGTSGGDRSLYVVNFITKTTPYYIITSDRPDLLYLLAGGHDVYTGYGDDIIYSNGNNQIHAGPGDDLVTSIGRDLAVFGDAGDDTLIGSSSHDFLYGGADDDVINAGDGGDFIQGGTGNDTLTGGSGADFFDFDFGDGHDVITDYQAGIDTIAISFAGSGERPSVSYAKVGSDWIITYGSDGSTITVQSEIFNTDDLLIS